MRPSILTVPFLSRCTRWRAARIESGEENEEKDDQRYESKEERRRETGRKERRDRVRLSRGVERQKRGWRSIMYRRSTEKEGKKRGEGRQAGEEEDSGESETEG